MSSHGAAFLTSAYVERSRPTVVEVVAQEGLINTLQPAYHQLIKLLAAQLLPNSLQWLPPAFGDELFLVANSGLQLHYLRLFSASFSENFYGLERMGERRPRLHLSYLLLVLAPYLHRKLESLFQRLREDEADGIRSQGSTELAISARRKFVHWYPFWHAVWSTADLALLMAFTFRATDHHSLASYLVGYRLAYLTPESSRRHEERSASLLKTTHGLRHLLLSAALAASQAVSLGLEVGSFFLQVLEHWYSRTDSSLKVAASQGHLPPPPPQMTSAATLAPGRCPLCRRSRRGATVVATSGVVYCYACIARQLRAEGRCPVSGLRTDESQLVRIFGRQE